MAPIDECTDGVEVEVAGLGGRLAIAQMFHPLAALSASVLMITKGGINAISRSLAMEYATQGIRVNAVAPGVELILAVS